MTFGTGSNISEGFALVINATTGAAHRRSSE
jgi:hypothetical protein